MTVGTWARARGTAAGHLRPSGAGPPVGRSVGPALGLVVLVLAACGTQPEQQPAPPRGDLGDVRFAGDGIDLGDRVLSFGDDVEAVAPVLADALGPTSVDTGETPPFGGYGTCPGTRLRVLEHLDGAVRVFFGDAADGGPGGGGGPLEMFAWSVLDEGPRASEPIVRALVGDRVTAEFGIGIGVAELEERLGEALVVHEGNEVHPPRFDVVDQSGGLTGTLTAADGVVGYVTAGRPCAD